MADIEIKVPANIKLANTSDRAISFVPYRENFVTTLAKGVTLEFPVDKAGQVLYYLQQATEGFAVSQIASFDSASETVKVFETPAVMTIANTSDVVKAFVPYRENFNVDVKAGDTYKVEASTIGQILYYMAQATEGLTVSYAKKTTNPGS